LSKVQEPITVRMTLEPQQDDTLKVAFLQYKSPALSDPEDLQKQKAQK